MSAKQVNDQPIMMSNDVNTNVLMDQGPSDDNKLYSEDEVATHIFFLDRDELYETVKPYVIQYDVNTCVPSENLNRSLCSVNVKNFRRMTGKLQFAECGFQLIPLKDYENEEKIRTIHVPDTLDRVKEKFRSG